jgi:hypothetical protein
LLTAALAMAGCCGADGHFGMDRKQKSGRGGAWAIVLTPLLSFAVLIAVFVLLRQAPPENEIPSLQSGSGYAPASITETNASMPVVFTNSAQ